jgi:hypothetical protein
VQMCIWPEFDPMFGRGIEAVFINRMVVDLLRFRVQACH